MLGYCTNYHALLTRTCSRNATIPDLSSLCACGGGFQFWLVPCNASSLRLRARVPASASVHYSELAKSIGARMSSAQHHKESTGGRGYMRRSREATIPNGVRLRAQGVHAERSNGGGGSRPPSFILNWGRKRPPWRQCINLSPIAASCHPNHYHLLWLDPLPTTHSSRFQNPTAAPCFQLFKILSNVRTPLDPFESQKATCVERKFI